MAEGIGQKLIDLMIDRHITISTAESCTGGMLAAHIVDIPGASRVFHEGYITYNDDAKIHVLNVSKKTIAKYTAVSSETAAEMAEGCQKAAKSDIAVSVTGFAGPEDTALEPKGLVYIGCAYKGKAEAFKYKFEGDRNQIRFQAALKASEIAYVTLVS